MSRILTSKMTQAVDVTRQSLASDAVSDYELLEQQIGMLNTTARETFQNSFRAVYDTIATKLSVGTPLSDKELEALRLLIVGEAEYYLKYENNFEDWKAELKRLADEIAGLQDKEEMTVDEILHLQALCRDARGVIANILFYLRERDRLERFQERTQNAIDPEAGKLFAGLIREMMESEQM